MELTFTPRKDIAEKEWDPAKEEWKRVELDRKTLNELTQRSNLHGLLRVGLFTLTLVVLAMATMAAARHSLWLAIPVLYAYYFFYGFWVAIAHELQHKIVFDRSLNWLSEIIFFIVQTLIWNSPRYARISHRLHHRYTMVRGMDPETDWPEVITSKWLRNLLFRLISNILVVGAIIEWFGAVRLQVRRILGVKDRMMRDHCSEQDIRIIRIESLAILLIHLAVVAAAIVFKRWELVAFISLAWQIGSPIEGLWHFTEHIGRPYNVNDPRLCTRSIRVSGLVHLIYGGLDDHVDHHLYPGVPSQNLPKLHKILKKDLPEPRNIIGCWQEMFAIAREKDRRPDHEYIPIPAGGIN